MLALRRHRRETWRSAFWFMTGLSAVCCVGAWFSIDHDEPYQLEDKCVYMLSEYHLHVTNVYFLPGVSTG